MTLGEMKPGTFGRISRVNCNGNILRRILEMGVTPGTHVEVLRVAPLGDPIEIKIRGYLLTLRKDEATEIYMEE